MKDPVPSAPAPETSPLPPTGERGVGAARWWPERYDAVVERWIEDRRAARDDRPR